MTVIAPLFIFLVGTCVGSFLNVCIHRMPNDESVVRPGSKCPACGKMIVWFDNIPLLSFLLLGARCRHCKARISIRYFLVELATGILWLSLWFQFGLSPYFFAAIIYFSMLLALSVTDIETGLLPDVLTFPGMLAGLVMSSVFPALHQETIWYMGLFKSLTGLLAGGAILLVTGWIGTLIFRKEAMGGGDIKLLAMIGSFTGVSGGIFVFMFAPVVSMPLALFEWVIRKKRTIAFGPYLALVGAWFFVWGHAFLKAYFHY